jgi:hypothetical protein
MLTAGEQFLQRRLTFCYELWGAVKLVSARRLEMEQTCDTNIKYIYVPPVSRDYRDHLGQRRQ